MTTDSALSAVTTYRYLRISMVLLIVGLAGAVAYEAYEVAGDCLQTSISAYYYTPAQGIFVGTLVALGLGMVVLKGNTDWEDILLNLAGMLAPVVALVPTPYRARCYSVPVDIKARSANVANNVTSLFVVAVLAMLVTGLIAWHQARTREWTVASSVGAALAGAILLVAAGFFWWDRAAFLQRGHYVAAIAMFVCIVLVVLLNAGAYGRQQEESHRPQPLNKPASVNRYLAVAVAMVVSSVGMGLWRWLFGWEHAVLWIEATLITLFAVFWILQTRELWSRVRRGGPAVADTPR